MLTPAICTQCGANIEVDASREAGVCKFCGTAFITEKAINNYITNHSTVHNVTENVTKIILGNEKDEGSDHFKRGVTMLKLSKGSGARRAFKKACALSPEKAEYWFYYAASHTNAFTSTKRGFDTEEDESEYGLAPCFEALNSFFALATEEEKDRLGNEFGLDLNKGAIAVLLRIFENLKVENNRPDLLIFDLSNFSDSSPENLELMKHPDAANALADFFIKEKIIGYAASGISFIYPIIRDSIDSDRLNKIRPLVADQINKITGGNLYIADTSLLNEGEFSDGTLRIARQGVTAISIFPDSTEVEKLIVTPSIVRIQGFTNLKVTVFEEGVLTNTMADIISLTHDVAYIPDSCKQSVIRSYSTLANPSCVVYSKAATVFIAASELNKNSEHFNAKLGYIHNGKIVYPQHVDQEVFDKFNENLIKYFKNEIESGEITGFIKDPTPQNTKKGCYVATCVYGSYDCPEVWTLRRYRDEKLAKSTLGRLFIKLYYAVSPKIVKLFGKSKWFNKFFKKRLDKKVEKLRNSGFESTPYDDPQY